MTLLVTGGTGILGGTSGRNGVGGSIHPSVGFDFWKSSVINHWDTDVFIHSWSTEAKQTLVDLYQPKKFIVEEQREFNPDLKLYGDLSLEALSKDRRYLDLVKEYSQENIDECHPSLLSGDSSNLWEHLKYQVWCQHSKWYANQQAVRLKREAEEENNFIYDYVVLGRFDLYFRSVFPFDTLDQEKFYASPRNHGKSFRPDHDIALMDMWFLSPSKMMDRFANLYDSIYDYCVTGPHASRERIVELFGHEALKYLFLDGIDYGALRHIYSDDQIPKFAKDGE